MLPKINETLYLQINSIDEEESKELFKSRIADIRDDFITMQVPINEKTGKFKRLFVGDELSVYFMEKGGSKNFFTTTVMGFKEDVMRLVIIKKPDENAITKSQRRNYLRVPAILEIAVQISEHLHFIADTDDVGGGGISWLCDKHIPVQEGNIASCWLLLPAKAGKADHVSFKGELVRVKPLETPKQIAMLRFTDIADRDRQKLIRFCFERQMEFRKN